MCVKYLKCCVVVFCFGFLLFFNQLSLAQDIIELRDNSEIKALIEKIEGDKIFFKKYESIDNNTLFIYKTAVRKIYYRDGSVLNFEAANEEKIIEYKADYATETNQKDKECMTEVFLMQDCIMINTKQLELQL